MYDREFIINCKIAVCNHINGSGQYDRDVRADEIREVGVFMPSYHGIFKYGGDVYFARATDDRKSIEITEYEPAGGSIWDVLSADSAES
jgi:hypothetical protein